MAWNDHPQKSRGHLYIHRPEPVQTMRVNGGVAYPADDVNYDGNAGESSWNYINRHRTVSFGSTAYGWDKGVCPAQYVNHGTTKLYLPWVVNGIRPGEINPADDDYITIWEDFRPWFLSPYIVDYGGGSVLAGKKGKAPDNLDFKALNIGSGGVFAQANATGYWSGPFSCLNSCSPKHRTLLWTTTNETLSDGNLSVSSTYSTYVKANMIDGSSATRWESSTNANEWFKYDFGAGNEKAVAMYEMMFYTANSGPYEWRVEWSDDDSTYTPVSYEQMDTSPSITATYHYWYTDNPPAARYWRWTLVSAEGASRFTVSDVNIYTQNALPVTWDVGNGDIEGGYSANDTEIEARFPVGLSWIKAAATTSTVDGDDSLARRPIVVMDANKWIATIYDCTITGTIGSSASNAYDGSLSTAWGGFLGSSFADITFPTFRVFKGVRVYSSDAYGKAPHTLRFSVADPITGAFTQFHEETPLTWSASGEWKEFLFDSPQWGDTFRVTQYNTPSDSHVYEIEWIYEYAYGVSLNKFTVQSHTIESSGQEMTFRVYEDLSNYPPGTLVMYHEDEYYQGVKGSLSAADPTGESREGLVFVGWVDQRASRVWRTPEGQHAYTDLVCYDIGGWAKRFPSMSYVFRRWGASYTSQGEWNLGVGWLAGLSVDQIIFALMSDYYHLLELADFFPSDTYQTYRIPVRETGGGNLFDTADGMAQTIAHRLTCNKMGQFKIIKDLQLFSSGDRGSTYQQTLEPGDIKAYSYKRVYTSRVGRHWGLAVEADASHWEDISSGMTSFFCVAPDVDFWSQGLGQIEHGEQVVVDQAELNTREGQRYAVRSNPEFSHVDIEIAHGNDAGIDPAHPDPVRLTIDSTNKAPDGYTCTNKRAYPVRMTIRRNAEKMTKEVLITLEMEVDGIAADTFTPPT